MRLTQTALTDYNYWSPLVGANRFDPFQQVVSRIGDRQEFLRCDLRRASVGVVGKLNSCPFQALATKFFS